MRRQTKKRILIEHFQILTAIDQIPAVQVCKSKILPMAQFEHFDVLIYQPDRTIVLNKPQMALNVLEQNLLFPFFSTTVLSLMDKHKLYPGMSWGANQLHHNALTLLIC